MKLTGGTAEETILAAEPPEEASEKPKSEQKVEPKVQKPKAEPKATEKTEITPKMGKAKFFLCYFPPEVIGEIGIFKNLMGMSSGEFLMQAIAEWKKNHENLVQTVTQINDLKMAGAERRSRRMHPPCKSIEGENEMIPK